MRMGICGECSGEGSVWETLEKEVLCLESTISIYIGCNNYYYLNKNFAT